MGHYLWSGECHDERRSNLELMQNRLPGNGSSERPTIALPHKAENVPRSQSIAESSGECVVPRLYQRREIIRVQFNSWPTKADFTWEIYDRRCWSWHQFALASSHALRCSSELYCCRISFLSDRNLKRCVIPSFTLNCDRTIVKRNFGSRQSKSLMNASRQYSAKSYISVLEILSAYLNSKPKNKTPSWGVLRHYVAST